MRWTLLRGAALAFGLSAELQTEALHGQVMQTLRLQDAAASVGQVTGRPAVIVFYSTICPNSRAMFPSLVDVARRYQSAGVDFLVYSTDDEEDEAAIPGFLAKYHAPFSPMWVEPWVPGEFSRVMARVGIHAGKTWTKPLVAIRDPNGRIVAQAEGVTDLSPLMGALGQGE